MGTDDDRPKIDSVIDAVVVRFKEELNEDEQIKCKSSIKNFNRCYPYFSAIMPYESPEWGNAICILFPFGQEIAKAKDRR